MKVTFVPRLDGNLIRGGAEIQVDATRAALEKLGIEVQILSPLDRTVGDVVHFFGPWESHWLCAATLLERGIPYVCSPIWLSSHSPAQEAVRRTRHKVGGRFPRLLGKLFTNARALMTLSEWEQTRLISYFRLSPEKFVRVPNGVDRSFAHASPAVFTAKYGITQPYVLHTGSYCDRKNQLGVIKALRDFEGIVVFAGQTLDHKYRRMCEKKATARMLLLDAIPSDSDLLPSAYAGARVFCLPSSHEVLSLSALEAAVAGCRLVLGNTWGAEEHFGAYAEYVNPGSSGEIKRAVAGQWHAPHDRESQKRHFEAAYSWDAVANQLVKVYDRLVGVNG